MIPAHRLVMPRPLLRLLLVLALACSAGERPGATGVEAVLDLESRRSWCSVNERQERVFFFALEATGPLSAVVIDCGAAGRTKVVGRLLAGERRTLSVPLPLSVPLWRETLSRLELPVPSVLGGDEQSAARLVSPASPQPLGKLEALPPGLLARAAPPVSSSAGAVSWSALLAIGLSCAFTLALRRRIVLATCVAGLGATVAAWTAASQLARAPDLPVVLFEADLAADLWLETQSARAQLPLGFEGLWSEPSDAPLEIELDWSGVGRVRTPAETVLIGRRRARGTLSPEGHGLGELHAVWTRLPPGSTGSEGRSPSGWSFHGAWGAGEALPAARAGPSPPGWLVAGLPPGIGTLVAALRGPPAGRWVRATGFD